MNLLFDWKLNQQIWNFLPKYTGAMSVCLVSECFVQIYTSDLKLYRDRSVQFIHFCRINFKLNDIRNEWHTKFQNQVHKSFSKQTFECEFRVFFFPIYLCKTIEIVFFSIWFESCGEVQLNTPVTQSNEIVRTQSQAINVYLLSRMIENTEIVFASIKWSISHLLSILVMISLREIFFIKLQLYAKYCLIVTFAMRLKYYYYLDFFFFGVKSFRKLNNHIQLWMVISWVSC